MTDVLLLSRLEDALEREGCPVCYECDRATRQYLTQFLRDGKSSERAWARFREARGFCRDHTRRLVERDETDSVAGLSTATLYGWLLADLRAAALETDGGALETHPGRRRRRNGFQHWLTPMAPCPACRDTTAYGAAVTGSLLRFLSPHRGCPEIQARFRRSRGLWLDHFRELLSQAEDPATSGLLLEVERRAVCALAQDLETFRQTFNDRADEAPSNSDPHVWRRTIDLFACLAVRGEAG